MYWPQLRSLPHPPDNLLRREWQLIDLDAKRPQRILYRPRHCRRRDHAPTFTAALDTIGSKGRRGLVMIDLDGGYLRSGRQQGVVEGCCHILPLLVQGDSDALGDPTVNLPLERARVHYCADIMYGNVLEKFDIACFYVNFYDGDMHGVPHNRVERSQIFPVFRRRGGEGMVVGKAALQATLHIRG